QAAVGGVEFPVLAEDLRAVVLGDAGPLFRSLGAAAEPVGCLAPGVLFLAQPTGGGQSEHHASPPPRWAGISGQEPSITLFGSPPCSGVAFVRNHSCRPACCSARHAFCAANS